MFSWLSSVMADTKRTTKNRGLSCQQRNAQHHSNTRRKNPARVRFSAERVFREKKKTRGRNLDRRSPSQKTKQQNARKPANHLRGSGRHDAGRTAGRGDAGQNNVRTFRSPWKPTAPLALQRTVNNCSESLFASTNKGNSM